MARILTIDTIDDEVKATANALLRSGDELVSLPQSCQSLESGVLKNVVMRLDGSHAGMRAGIFSPNWFAGVSAILVPPEVAQPLLRDATRREAVLQALTKSIRSEMQSTDIHVGPALDADDQDRDRAPWESGLDSPGSCIGLYAAVQERAPEPDRVGMHRPHEVYFLVCKAGGGIAAQTFHTRLVSSLTKGTCLDAAFADGGEPGSQALRRVARASERNRARCLLQAARAIGFHAVDTISDNANSPKDQARQAITLVSVQTNTLRRCENTSQSNPQLSVWQYYSGCVDTTLSDGLITSSNVHSGFVLFATATGGYNVHVRNDAYDAVPFGSPRRLANRTAIMQAIDYLRERGTLHPDEEWIRQRFAWAAKDFGIDLAPPSIWGTHEPETYSSLWGRELGLATLQPIRLRPELVALAAVEPAKLRAAAKNVLEKNSAIPSV